MSNEGILLKNNFFNNKVNENFDFNNNNNLDDNDKEIDNHNFDDKNNDVLNVNNITFRVIAIKIIILKSLSTIVQSLENASIIIYLIFMNKTFRFLKRKSPKMPIFLLDFSKITQKYMI